MKKLVSLFWAACIALPLFAQGKGKIVIPDLKGYVTLKCDFHIHTVFSDGLVWPTVRVSEAYREGLDAISITDHLESRRYLKELEKHSNLSFNDLSRNIAYELAQTTAEERGIILVRGSEITRGMPPGHHNAIFLTNSDELDKPDYMDAFRAAKSQNAFIYRNHPWWWYPPPPRDTALWLDEHTQLLQQGMLHGIEIVNGGKYSPDAHRWCLEKKLTMMAGSDAHAPICMAPDKYRSMTLVFARIATPEAIHEALKERRTAVYNEGYIIGEEKYLKELFENALEWSVKKTGKEVNITFSNRSGLTFHLKVAGNELNLPFVIAPNGVQVFPTLLLENLQDGDVSFIVENFLVAPNEGMGYTINAKNL